LFGEVLKCVYKEYLPYWEQEMKIEMDINNNMAEFERVLRLENQSKR